MRSAVAAILHSRLSALGVALTTASGLLFVVLVGLDLLGFLENTYAGLIVFIMVPALFVAGLLLIPIGLWRERRRAAAGRGAPRWPVLNFGDPNARRAVLFVAVATIVNLVIVSFASYGAVEYAESQTFCGQTCHTVMQPEFVAHQNGPHARVHCVTCHVGPGPQSFVKAKLNGVRQVYLVAAGSYRRPIPTPVETMPSVAGTCQQCHWPNRFIGDVVKVFTEHADNQANTEAKTTVRLHVGGPTAGTGSGAGIHWHTNPVNAVEYVALDDKREQIAYVRRTAPDGAVHEYYADGVSPASLDGKPRRRMDCLDCHNRPAHTFAASAEGEIDRAIGDGRIDRTLPFIRRAAVRALKADYSSRDVAVGEIDRTIRADVAEAGALDQPALRQAIAETQAIYARNIFPTMSVRWGSYATQTGHTSSNGCFRCHDDQHKTRQGRAIGQDCELCHAIE